MAAVTTFILIMIGPIIIFITVKKLLLRESQEFSSLRKVSTLHCSYGGKGPACATMALILDGSDTTSLYPVDVYGKI